MDSESTKSTTSYEAFCILYSNFIHNIDPYLAQVKKYTYSIKGLLDGFHSAVYDFLQSSGLVQYEAASEGSEGEDPDDGDESPSDDVAEPSPIGDEAEYESVEEEETSGAPGAGDADTGKKSWPIIQWLQRGR